MHGFLPVVNTAVLHYPLLVESLDVEPWIRRNHRYRGLTINYVPILDCVEGRRPWPPHCSRVNYDAKFYEKYRTGWRGRELWGGDGWSGKTSRRRSYLNKVLDEVWELAKHLLGWGAVLERKGERQRERRKRGRANSRRRLPELPLPHGEAGLVLRGISREAGWNYGVTE